MKHVAFPDRRSVSALPVVGLVLVGVAALGMTSGVFGDGGTRTNLVNLTLGLAALLAAGSSLYAWRRQRSVARAWLCFGLACLAWAGGQMIWIWIESVRAEVPSYPSWADLGFLAFTPTFALGMLLLIRRMLTAFSGAELALDGLVTIAIVGYAAFVVVLHPASNGYSFDMLASILWQAGTMAVIAFASIVLLVRPDLLGLRSTVLLVVGLLIYTTSSGVYGRLALEGTYTSGTLLDLGWIWGFLLIAAAALAARDSERAVRESSMHSEQRIVLLRASMMTVSVLAFTVLATRTALFEANMRSIAIGTAIAGVVLALRLGYAGVQAGRLRERTRERDRLAGVVAASNVIGTSLELDEILPRLARAAAETVDRARAEVYIFALEGRHVEAFVQHGFPEHERQELAALSVVPVGVFRAEAEAIWTRRPVIQRVSEGGIPEHLVAAFERMGKRHSLVAPLLAGTEVVGIFDIWSPFDESPFMQEDVEAVAAIGQQAGRAVQHARTLAQERERAVEQQSLRRVIAAGIAATDLTTTLREMVSASSGLAGSEACSVEIWHPEEHAAELVAETSIAEWPGDYAHGHRYDLDVWTSARRVLTEQITLNLLRDDPELSALERESLASAGTSAILMIPLVVGDTCLGVLNMFRRAPERFSAKHMRTAQELATQMALAIDRARLLADERRRADEQETMRRIVQTFVSNDNLQEMLQATLEASLGIARAEFAMIELIEPGETFTTSVAAAYLELRPTDQHVPNGRRYDLHEWQSTAWVLRECRTLVGTSNDPRFSPFEQTYLRESGIGSIIVTPLMIGTTATGVLNLSTRDVQPFTADEIRRVEEVATQIALAIERSRLISDERQRAREQEALRTILQGVVSSSDLTSMSEDTTEAAMRLTSMEFSAIELWSPERGETTVMARSHVPDWPAYDHSVTTFTVDELWPTFLRALQGGEQVQGLVREMTLNETEQRHFDTSRTGSFAITPMKIGDRVIGILNVASRQERRLREHELTLLREIAAEMGLAVERTQLLAALQERADTDGLTGVRNHRAILETLDQEIARTRRTGNPLTIMMIDLDGFKQVNDTAGHQAGDDVLRRVAGFLRENLREVDRVGRYGGDEFLLVMPDLDPDGARQVVTRLLDRADQESVVLWSTVADMDRTSQPIGPLGRPALPTVPMRLSIGMASLPEDGMLRPDLLVTADARMYEAKAARRWIDLGAGRDARQVK